jgi:hypothetical protein
MSRLASLSLAATILAASAACSPSARMDANDDMAAPAPSGGMLTGDCASCFDNPCGWQQTQCAGDPGCARWLTSVRVCPASPDGHADATCLSAGLPSDPTARAYATAVTDCVARAEDCCVRGNDGPSGGGGGGAGSGPTYDGDASILNPDGGSSALCWEDDCSCMGCLHAIKSGQAQDNACAEIVAGCFEDTSSGCAGFAAAYAECAATDKNPPACYEALYSNPQYAAAIEAFQGVQACALQYCSRHCFGADQADCLDCQKANCLDALQAVLADPDAQLFHWCRQQCESNSNCIQQCASKHSDGLQIFQVLAQCTAQACSASCAAP